MFLIYRKETSAGSLLYSLKDKGITLARYIQAYMDAIPAKPPFLWSMNEKDLLSKMGYDPDVYSFVIDLKPTDSKVSLYEVRNIFGCREEDWAPLAFHLESIYVDEDPNPKTPEGFKRRFPVIPSKRENVCTFLYLRKNKKGGRWNWGRAGSTNAALLWPEVFAFFCDKLRQTLCVPGQKQIPYIPHP